jgi:pyruvate/2-oxoglutarate dehydrogenase complex dihydrolipoamide acyltransferase (E2) component
MVPILLPDMGTAATVFSLWHVAVGEHVFEGERVAEVRIPGAIYDVPAPVSGFLHERLVRPNDRLTAGQPLGTITADADE